MCFSLSCWQVEIKNLNSFSAMNRAIDFEISRQVSLHSQDQRDQIVQETRLWEEGGQVVATSFFFFTLLFSFSFSVSFVSWMLICSSNFCCYV